MEGFGGVGFGEEGGARRDRCNTPDGWWGSADRLRVTAEVTAGGAALAVVARVRGA